MNLSMLGTPGVSIAMLSTGLRSPQLETVTPEQGGGTQNISPQSSPERDFHARGDQPVTRVRLQGLSQQLPGDRTAHAPDQTSFSAAAGPQFDDDSVVSPLSPCSAKKSGNHEAEIFFHVKVCFYS